jgi:hypothetical protein
MMLAKDVGERPHDGNRAAARSALRLNELNALRVIRSYNPQHRESFGIDDTPELSDADIAAAILAAVREAPALRGS